MLSRFLDKKNQNKGDAKRNAEARLKQGVSPEQGSLLDLLGTANSAQSRPNAHGLVAPPPIAPRSGSLLNEIDNVEAQQRRQLEQLHAAYAAEQAALQEADQQRRQQGAAMHPSSRRPRDQEEQLDLLTQELDQIKNRSNAKPVEPQVQHSPVSGAGAVPPTRGVSSHFSFERTVGSVMRSWKHVALCAIIGAVLAAIYSLTLPNMYQSVAEILIEPRGLKVLNNAVTPNGLNSEATVAYAESQVRIIASSSVVDPVIEDLKLTEDPEFTEPTQGGELFGLVSRIWSGEAKPAGKLAAARKYLYSNLHVQRVGQTFTIDVAVSTTDPAKSARIANALARSYIADESGARSSVARSASEDLTSRLDELRQKVRINEEKVEQYKAANGLVDANGRLVSEVQLSRLNEQLVLAKVQAGDAKTRAELAAKADLGDVISGSLPTALNGSTVSQLRLDYSRANARLERLAAKLGVRHPDRIAAASERRSVLNAISQELQRVVQTEQENYKRAKARQDDLTAQVTQLKAAAVNDSAAMVKLRELNRQVEASRQIYESFLLRSRETGEQENIRSSSARIISKAVPIEEKAGPMRKAMVALGAVVGAGVGIIFALIPLVFAAFRHIRVNESGQSSTASAVGGRPEAPQVVGDLYSSQPVSTQPDGQMPLPGLGPQRDTATASPVGSAPQPQNAPPIYYENWRQ